MDTDGAGAVHSVVFRVFRGFVLERLRRGIPVASGLVRSVLVGDGPWSRIGGGLADHGPSRTITDHRRHRRTQMGPGRAVLWSSVFSVVFALGAPSARYSGGVRSVLVGDGPWCGSRRPCRPRTIADHHRPQKARMDTDEAAAVRSVVFCGLLCFRWFQVLERLRRAWRRPGSVATGTGVPAAGGLEVCS